MAIFEPGVCEMERGAAVVQLQPGKEKGRTLWTPDLSDPQQVAVKVDAEKFFDAYFGAFAPAAAQPAGAR